MDGCGREACFGAGGGTVAALVHAKIAATAAERSRAAAGPNGASSEPAVATRRSASKQRVYESGKELVESLGEVENEK